MKKKNNKKSKPIKQQEYAFGTGIPGMGFDIASDLLIGSSMNAVTSMIGAIRDGEKEQRLGTKNTNRVMAMGGETSSTVEVEGEEVYEKPNGEQGEFEGPSHEQGGITTDLPDGTKIFSDRLKVGGKTMAERKKAREQKVQKLNKLLTETPSDKILKGTLERVTSNNAVEEAKDMEIQQAMNDTTEKLKGLGMTPEFGTGGTINFKMQAPSNGTKTFATGGKVGDGITPTFGEERPQVFTKKEIEAELEKENDRQWELAFKGTPLQEAMKGSNLKEIKKTKFNPKLHLSDYENYVRSFSPDTTGTFNNSLETRGEPMSSEEFYKEKRAEAEAIQKGNVQTKYALGEQKQKNVQRIGELESGDKALSQFQKLKETLNEGKEDSKLYNSIYKNLQGATDKGVTGNIKTNKVKFEDEALDNMTPPEWSLSGRESTVGNMGSSELGINPSNTGLNLGQQVMPIKGEATSPQYGNGGMINKYGNGTPPSGTGTILKGVDQKYMYRYDDTGNNPKWYSWDMEGKAKDWTELTPKFQSTIDLLKKTTMDKDGKFIDKYLYNPTPPDFNTQGPTMTSLLGQETPANLLTTNQGMQVNPLEVPTTVPEVYPEYIPEMSTKEQYTQQLAQINEDVDNPTITNLMQGLNANSYNYDEMAGKYPLDPNATEETPSKKNKLKDLFKNLLGGGEGQGGAIGDLTRGDVMGLAGNMEGKFGPLATTLLNQMATPKNENFYREFGADALSAITDAQGLATSNRDKMLQDIQLRENTLRSQNRNTARGVNTMRSLDIAADISGQQSVSQAYNQYAQQMMGILGQKAGLENVQDEKVMTGEYQRDLADRQDTDNFYTNLSKNVANASEFSQKTGRDLNQSLYNKDVMNAMNQMSQYGFGWKRMPDGSMQLVNLNKSKETVEEKKAAAKEKALELNANESGTKLNR